MKICLVEAELFHADGQTQRDMKKLLVALCIFANAFCICIRNDFTCIEPFKSLDTVCCRIVLVHVVEGVPLCHSLPCFY